MEDKNNFVYTQENYEEDLKISQYVFKKFIKGNLQYKEDLIQVSLIELSKCRQKYNIEKGAYTTFATRVSKNAMLMFLRKEQRIMNNYSNISMETIFLDQLKLSDILEDKNDFTESLQEQNLYKILTSNNKLKKTRIKLIAKLFLSNKSQIEISKTLKISRSLVSRYINKFKEISKEILTDLKYFEIID